MAIRSLTGATTEGLPLSFNRAPCDALKPWIARIGVTAVFMPKGERIECGTFSEHPIARINYGARWAATTAEGRNLYDPDGEAMPLYFGPCTKWTPLTAFGDFQVVSINFVPGGSTPFDVPPQGEALDRIFSGFPLSHDGDVHEDFAPCNDPQAWLARVEARLLEFIGEIDPAKPDPLLGKFECQCLLDPTQSVKAIAEKLDVNPRTLERIIKREWGVTPNFALRRSRAYDMAAALIDVAAENESELRLRYFDQSHLIREIKAFFGMTPRKLAAQPRPLLTITSEIRQSRRLEILGEEGKDPPRPWRDPAAEPDAVSRTAS